MEDSSRDGAHSRDADWLVMTSIFITTRFSQSEVEIWASTQFREPKFSLQNCFFKSGKIWTAKRHATALERTKSNENKNGVQQKTRSNQTETKHGPRRKPKENRRKQGRQCRPDNKRHGNRAATIHQQRQSQTSNRKKGPKRAKHTHTPTH